MINFHLHLHASDYKNICSAADAIGYDVDEFIKLGVHLMARAVNNRCASIDYYLSWSEPEIIVAGHDVSGVEGQL
ncbi:hypothetical protein [Cupriavidus numazuensis]|uniref:hypothetical protein n=1 Tax=Cupriavidus numazuensis TaxID=221992 RepID=UPI001BA49D3F|nr:hypothetical protein [Cupriavidus numazuensis]